MASIRTCVGTTNEQHGKFSLSRIIFVWIALKLEWIDLIKPKGKNIICDCLLRPVGSFYDVPILILDVCYDPF